MAWPGQRKKSKPAFRPQIVRDTEAKDDSFNPADLPSLYQHSRRSSGSSKGASEYDIPHETDFETDEHADREDSDENEVELEPAPKKPNVRASRRPAVKSETAAFAETDWDRTCRLKFPNGRGELKLLDQTTIVQDVVREAMVVGNRDMVCKKAYGDDVSRGIGSQNLLRRAAKRLGVRADLVYMRARADIQFCRHLAPLIFARFAKSRNDIRNLSLQKVAGLYELTKPGITSRSDPPAPPASGADPVTSPVVPVKHSNRDDLKYFKVNGPFLAPIISEICRETWFHNSKAFGFKPENMKLMVSYCKELPNEKELPASMIGLVGTIVFASIMTYSTGRYLPASEFSQSRLEDTYLALVQMIDGQRTQSNPAKVKAFHKVMHQLYLDASNSKGPTRSAPSGSAANVMQLDLSD
ncbi:hypothetical protein B0H14DRAFT_3509735 [Mycena olivaceomarginata]|nr:hypothetical protein B0H14DRAFT_3509735 [Mycena olivaceomarginata]